MVIQQQVFMHWLKRVITFLAVSGIVCTALPSVATRYRPRQNLQRPEGRQGGATRSACVGENFTFEPILPGSNYGLTTVDYPTVYWHLSNHKFTWAKVELYPTPTPIPPPGQEAVPLYSKTVKLAGETPLHSFTLPNNEGLKPLEVGQEYLWKVTLICSKLGPDDDSADGSQRTIQGSILRVAPPETLPNKLSKTQQPYDVYAEEGFWYDAIQDLAVKRQSQPQTPQLNRDWCDLLKETRLNNQCCE